MLTSDIMGLIQVREHHVAMIRCSNEIAIDKTAFAGSMQRSRPATSHSLICEAG